MRYLTFLIIGFIFCFGCSRTVEKKNNATKSSFDLKKDIYNLSERMEEGDTIILNANLGVCTSYCNEHNLLWKENGIIYIMSKIKEIDPNNDSISLGKTEYRFEKFDSLNFENLFSLLKDKTIKPDNSTSYTFQTIYKRDTLEFYPGNLVRILEKTYYYNCIKGRIYPNEKFFKPVILEDILK
jgi:hypothetical protein